MFNHPYIALGSRQPLPDSSVMSWFGSVRDAGPDGAVSSVELRADRNPVRFYHREQGGMHRYIVVLSRDLSLDETRRIAEAYDRAVPEGDFEITHSQQMLNEDSSRQEALGKDLIRAIALEAAKKSHNRWTHVMMEQGWRYGMNHSQRQRTTPMLTDWESLGERYQRRQYQRMMDLLEVLDGMNLAITRR